MPAKRFFYLLAGTNLLIIGVIVATFAVASGMAGGRSKNIAALKADVQTNDITIKNYETLQRTISQNQEINQLADQALPKGIDQAVLVNELNRFSQDTATPIRQITFNTAKGGGLITPSTLKGVSFATATVQVNRCQYQDLLRFLGKIENSRRRMQVTTISLNPSERTAGVIDRATLTLEIYLKP